MQDKLQELTDRLYNEGLSKGKQEGEELLQKAHAEADHIVADAKAEAERIIAQANKEAEGHSISQALSQTLKLSIQ